MTGQRQFSGAWADAGYHLNKWGPVPTAKSQVIGTYDTVHGGVPMRCAVRLLEQGPTGNPELEIEWADGMVVTVVDEATAAQYLMAEGAMKI